MAILIIAILVLAAAFIASKISRPVKETPEQVAGVIEGFVNGTGRPYDWDDFISVPIADKYLDEVRCVCSRTHDVFPPADRGWSNAEGMEVLQTLAADVGEYARTGKPPRAPTSLLSRSHVREGQLPDTFPYTARWDSVGLSCSQCAHFQGPERWPDSARTSRCLLHEISLAVQLDARGFMEGEWFCRDFRDGGTAHAPAVQHLNATRGSLQARVLYQFHRTGRNLGELPFDQLP